jgi:hypothetical protein
MSRIWWEPKVKEFEAFTKKAVCSSFTKEKQIEMISSEVEKLFDTYERKWVFFCIVFGISCFVAGILWHHLF